MTPLSDFLARRLPGPLAWVVLAFIYSAGLITIIWFADFGGNPASQYLDIHQDRR